MRFMWLVARPCRTRTAYARHACVPARCREVAKAWTSIKALDVSGKKKDTCKVVPEFKDEPAMRKAFVKGIVVAKVKKKAAPKKK